MFVLFTARNPKQRIIAVHAALSADPSAVPSAVLRDGLNADPSEVLRGDPSAVLSEVLSAVLSADLRDAAPERDAELSASDPVSEVAKNIDTVMEEAHMSPFPK